MTEDEAREVLVFLDAFELASLERSQAVTNPLVTGLVPLFDGALFSRKRDGTLSKAGKLLARFFIELMSKDLPAHTIEQGLRGLDDFTVAMLILIYKAKEDSR